MSKTAFAIGAHPDDIEFMMAGTLMLLKEAGYEIHYMNVANGSCGTNKYDRDTIVAMRREEAMAAAQSIGAVFHESLVNDIEIFYEREILLKLGSIVRQVAPEIILTHSPNDYMEDHSNTCRLAVTAAFCRGMINFPVEPAHKVTNQEVTIYHAMPHSLCGPLREPVQPDMFVDVSSVIGQKKKTLVMHKSQKDWLDESQGMDSYIKEMVGIAEKIGKLSNKFKYAESWRRHLHLGFCSAEADPLSNLKLIHNSIRNHSHPSS